MPLRRQSTAPASPVDALVRQIVDLERQVVKLRQPGRVSLPVLDYEKQIDPTVGEVAIHHPGNHPLATDASPFVYWHENEWRGIGAASGLDTLPYASASMVGGTVINETANYTDMFNDSHPAEANGTTTYDFTNAQGALALGSSGWGIRFVDPGIYFLQGSVTWAASASVGRFMTSIGSSTGAGTGLDGLRGFTIRTRTAGQNIVQTLNCTVDIYADPDDVGFLSIVSKQNSGSTVSVSAKLRIIQLTPTIS